MSESLIVAGIDEAGRGCLAGPVVAAAVILPETYDLSGLTDSKKLTAKRREALVPLIKEQAVAWGLGLCWGPEIDLINILQATKKAMCRAVDCLKVRPEKLLIDGNATIAYPLPQETVVKGDLKIPAISAASVLAKTFRDQVLCSLDKRYPGYNFAGHKGYGTAEHLAAIRELGPCRIHRMTFRGVKPEEKLPKEESLCLPGL